MKTNDARKLDHKMLTEMRKRAVASVQDGQNPGIVAKAMGVDRRTMYGWLALYRRGGWQALDPKNVEAVHRNLTAECNGFTRPSR